MHSCPSKHGIHKISSLSGTYGNNLHVRLTHDFLVIFPTIYNNIWNFDGKDYDSIIVEKDGVKSYIAISDIIRGKIIPNNKYSDDLPF